MRYSEARSVRTRPVVKGPGLVWQVSWGMLSCGRALCAVSGFVMAWQVWRVSFRCCGVGSGSARQGRCGIFCSGVPGHVALRIGALRFGRSGEARGDRAGRARLVAGGVWQVW